MYHSPVAAGYISHNIIAYGREIRYSYGIISEFAGYLRLHHSVFMYDMIKIFFLQNYTVYCKVWIFCSIQIMCVMRYALRSA